MCVFIPMMLFLVKDRDFILVLMYMYLLLWCFFIVKNVKIGFLFGVNVCVFIPMMLFYR